MTESFYQMQQQVATLKKECKILSQTVSHINKLTEQNDPSYADSFTYMAKLLCRRQKKIEKKLSQVEKTILNYTSSLEETLVSLQSKKQEGKTHQVKLKSKSRAN